MKKCPALIKPGGCSSWIVAGKEKSRYGETVSEKFFHLLNWLRKYSEGNWMAGTHAYPCTGLDSNCDTRKWRKPRKSVSEPLYALDASRSVTPDQRYAYNKK